MKREARCHCGQLTVTTLGDPDQVTMCHWEECQRRTGSSYNLGATFDGSNLELSGETKTYRRSGELGLTITFHFCPKCGSNVYWTFSTPNRDFHVVAVGCYADPSFPGPAVSVYGKRRHHWLPPLGGVPGFVEGARSEREDLT